MIDAGRDSADWAQFGRSSRTTPSSRRDGTLPDDGAARKVVGALLARGLIAEVGGRPRRSGLARDRRRQGRHAGRDRRRASRLSASRPPAGPQRPPQPRLRQVSPWYPPRPRSRQRVTQRRCGGKTREGTKQAQLIAMLRRAEGATIAADRRGDRMAAAHGAWRARGGAEEAAGARPSPPRKSTESAGSIASTADRQGGRQAAGLMFWFTRNRLAGSYLFFTSASRA